MWADNETATDLIGFAVHKDLILRLVTDERLLPLTVGVFGDWGGGKSSILRMLQKELDGDGHDDVGCLYFNGWTFEGYDDAKAALLSSVLVQLGEHKRFGPKVRHRIVRLLKRVDLMRGLPQLLRRGTPVVGAVVAAAASSAGLDPQLAIVGGGALSAAFGGSHQVDLGEADQSRQSNADSGEVDWHRLIRDDLSEPGPLDIRSFRHDFERLLADSDLRTLVVLIDDLDRCMPERLIANLEAIRLFLAVPKTAFVIAADPRIVRHAVSVRYAAPQVRDQQSTGEEPYDLVTDYIEKLIQIPYHLPRLSPSEIETYITLLSCERYLKDHRQYEKVCEHCQTARQRNLYVSYDAAMVREALGGSIPEDLERRLAWTSAIAIAIAEGLKGNPRQVKRFLNALTLRRELADIATLRIRDDVLVKLMLLEYTRLDVFEQLYQWQARSSGCPPELKQIEERAKSLAAPMAGGVGALTTSLPDGALPKWGERVVEEWARVEPPLANIDLRDYFWIARDRMKATAQGLSMVSPQVRRIYEGLMSANAGEREANARGLGELDQRERGDLLQLLSENIQRQPDGRAGVDGLLALADTGEDGAAATLMTAVKRLPVVSMDPSIAFDIERLAVEGNADPAEVRSILDTWKGTTTRIGAAARSAIDDLDRRMTGRP